METEAGKSVESARPRTRRGVRWHLAWAVGVLVVLELFGRLLLSVADDKTFFRFASLADIGDQPQRVEKFFRFASHRYIGYTPRPHWSRGLLKHNSLGFKDDEVVTPKPAGEFRVVCIGASTTYSSSNDDPKDTYPARLEQLFRDRGYPHVNVINAGADGYSSFEFLPLYLFRIRQLDPDLVVVHAGYNDVHSRLVWPPEEFLADNSGFRIAAIARYRVPPLWDHSALARIVGVSTGLLRSYGELRAIIDTVGPAAVDEELDNQVGRGVYPSGLFDEIPVEKILAANGDQHTLANLESLIVLAKHDGAKVLLTSEPIVMPELEGGSLVTNEVDEYGQSFKVVPILTLKPFRDAIRATDANVAKLAARLEVEWFDLAEAFPKDPGLFTDGLHARPEGERAKASLLFDHLVQGHLVPAPGQLTQKATPPMAGIQ